LIRARLTHAVKMPFKSIDMSGPETAKRSEPCIEFLKWFRLQTVEPPLCVHRRLHEPGIAQHAQVLRNGRLGHAELALDLPN